MDDINILIGSKYGLYLIVSDGSVSNCPDIMAVGSGGDMALSAMRALDKAKAYDTPMKRICNSVRIACQMDIHSGGPLQIKSQTFPA